ncbi:MAG: DUF3017 domain-containing protein [Candidatus Nanopelagicales bacterium]|nr:DUF3017 domain-containing protein [Candidatus Nanopelagicales bacterium]
MAVSNDGGGVVRRLPQRRKRLSFRQWPISIVLLGVVMALILVATDHFRRGSVVLAASVVLATFLRLLLSNDEAGWLAVRSKRTDVLVLGALGIGLAIFCFWVPAPN